MRPVLLRMAGFGSFREACEVDFTGADYFAFVGPTGAGKSTVIDAMTFALYGSVPRWDDRRAVGLALAPTAGRGTVSLVFEVEGVRYVVARELRRTASTGKVTVRNARLERLADPTGVAAEEEETVPLAAGPKEVGEEVERLLGLPFEDFCTCVVLPQGDFAEFLHAAPNKRQEKLERILGFGVYDVVMRRANAEGAAQQQRADLLGEQLGRYADATAEAERAGRARVAELAALAERVAAAVPVLGEAGADLAAVEVALARLGEEQRRLAAVRRPAGLAALEERTRSARTAVEAARAAVARAEAADTAARERLDAAPARGPLEQVCRAHAERAELEAALPGARERREKARAAYDTAAQDAAAALAAVEAARAASLAAAEASTEAERVVDRLVGEQEALRAPRLPAGLDEIERRRAEAAAAVGSAQARLTAAEAADARAREQLASAPARGPLELAIRGHRELAAIREEHRAAQQRRTAAHQAVDAAAVALARAAGHLEHARERQAEALRNDLAAELRPALVAGEECPVCAQTVAAPPPVLPAPDLVGAREAVAAAEQAQAGAQRAEAEARAELGRADGEVERLAATVARLREELAEAPPTAEAAAALLAERERLETRAAEADAEVRAARRHRDSADRAAEAASGAARQAAAALASARDPLVALGAPAAGEDVVAGWHALVGWAREAAAERERKLPAAQAAVAEARVERDATRTRLAEAERAGTRARRAETEAARAEQAADGEVAGIEQRLAALRAELADAPSAEEAAAELARIDDLAAAAREADGALRRARAGLAAAEADAVAAQGEVDAAWRELRRARDPLVGLGAPAVAGEDLGAAWEALLTWADEQAAARETELSGVQARREETRDRQERLARELAADLAEHGVALDGAGIGSAPERTVPGDADGAAGRGPGVDSARGGPDGAGAVRVDVVAGGAAPAVAAALERARGEHARIVERRGEVARLADERTEAQEQHQVAKMLGEQLRSNNFPRWLVASALDTLVADASVRLAELSGGQFELTHDNGEFLVVDHADADARRPVKTLSGGETFQASLALALALSDQLSGLAAQGAARLESIFLDEGFGTLDEANLEVVASTLESLATRGDRMVGVVTHVPALAERVPVRYVVARDQRTSTVVREGA